MHGRQIEQQSGCLVAFSTSDHKGKTDQPPSSTAPALPSQSKSVKLAVARPRPPNRTASRSCLRWAPLFCDHLGTGAHAVRRRRCKMSRLTEAAPPVPPAHRLQKLRYLFHLPTACGPCPMCTPPQLRPVLINQGSRRGSEMANPPPPPTQTKGIRREIVKTTQRGPRVDTMHTCGGNRIQ